MPRYSTSTSIYTRLPGLPNTTTNTTLIQQHADRVSGRVDAYVGKWYNVGAWTTTAVTPQMILEISDALTTNLTMRSLFTADGQNRNEWVEEWATQAMEDLRLLVKGDLKLFDSTGAEVARSGISPFVTSTTREFQPIFDIDLDTAWGPDADLIDRINRDRL